MNKKEIIIDLDNTILNTSQTLVNLNNKINPDKKLILPNELGWNFTPMIKTKEELSALFELFDRKDFYKEAILFEPVTKIINELSKEYKTIICSKHNASRKFITEKWAKKVFPKTEVTFVNDFSDKGKLFNNAYMIIDDRIDCLSSFSEKTLKVCFGKYSWNKEWAGLRMSNWKDINNILGQLPTTKVVGL